MSRKELGCLILCRPPKMDLLILWELSSPNKHAIADIISRTGSLKRVIGKDSSKGKDLTFGEKIWSKKGCFS